MMRQSFSKELENLQQELVVMGEKVIDSFVQAINALKTQDLHMAQQVIAKDDEIDNIQIQIEDKCFMLIALQQPIAKDLRILSTALKITTDLERMGDHAKNVAKFTLKVGTQPLIEPFGNIIILVEKIVAMLKEAMKAYANLDIQLADEVCKADNEVDALCDKIRKDLLNYMLKEPESIDQASQLLYVTRRLERSGDHATNIAEWVVYLVTGQRIKGN